MKTNVDLTASRTFSTQRREISLTKVMREFGKHFLWDYEHMKMVHSDYDLSNYRDSLILCGNASERQAQRFNHALDTGDICECCGARLTEKPWKSTIAYVLVVLKNLIITAREHGDTKKIVFGNQMIFL